MKTKIGSILAVGVCLLTAGCASLNANMFNVETLAADAATGATHQFNQYYQSATNGATAGDVTKLNSYRDEIYSADMDMSKALTVLDKARLDYAGNSADTNKTAMLAAEQAVSNQSSNIVALVKSFTAVHSKP